MALLLKQVIEGQRGWDSRAAHVPLDSRVLTFFYDLNTDKFVTHKPPAYVSENNRIVFPGHTVGFKPLMIGQFNYCHKQHIAYMLSDKGSEQQHLVFFLHRVLRMKKKRLNETRNDRKNFKGLNSFEQLESLMKT